MWSTSISTCATVNNFWSGITASLFLFMSYFGTDQSQVQRYLTGRSLAESRLGLIMNGLLKVPMQFLILLIGVMVFVFYQFEKPPMFFNQVVEEPDPSNRKKGPRVRRLGRPPTTNCTGKSKSSSSP